MNKNILDSDYAVSMMNMGQSIYSVSTIKPNYISAITTVNTFFIINLKSCVQTYEFDSKNIITDYILDSYYDNKKDLIQLACGNYNGIISTINFNVEKPEPYVEALVDTGIEQTFNSIGKFNEGVFITCSDKGLLYLIQEIPGVPKKFNLNTIKQSNIKSSNIDDDVEMNN